jgi:polyphosphate kinase 2 (PPK2 family)
VLESVDLDAALTKDEYQAVFPDLQDRLRRLQYTLLEAEVPMIIVFEGWDAAGKGTNIRHLTERLDPRAFRAWPGSPPSEMEQRYHFLWRYQTRLPEDGHMALFDHSWYGRVLVDRVEEWVKPKQWRGAFAQINELERWLTDDGQVLVKFWFHISQKEQKRRLEKMEEDKATRWQVQKEDWKRNRRYDVWLDAVEDMLARTDTPHAPWTIVEATDERWTRVKVFRTLVERMEDALKHREDAPAAVSRTQVAKEATKDERAQREKEQIERVRAVASEAGLPVEDDAFWVDEGTRS